MREGERRQDAIAEELRARLSSQTRLKEESVLSAVKARNDAEIWRRSCLTAQSERDKAQELYSQTIEDCAGALKGGEWAPARWDNPIHAFMCEEAVKEARKKVEALELQLKTSESLRIEADSKIAILTEDACGMREEINGHISTLHFLRVAVREREEEAEEAVARAEREAESLRHWQWETKAQRDIIRLEGVEVGCQTLDAMDQIQVPNTGVARDTDDVNQMGDVSESWIEQKRRIKMVKTDIHEDIIREWKELKKEKQETGFMMSKTEQPQVGIAACPGSAAPFNLNLTVNGINHLGTNMAAEKSPVVAETVTEPSLETEALLEIPINPIMGHASNLQNHEMIESNKTVVDGTAKSLHRDIRRDIRPPEVSDKEEEESDTSGDSTRIPFPFSGDNDKKRIEGLKMLSEREETRRLMRRTQFEGLNVRITDILGSFTHREGACTVAAPMKKEKACFIEKDKEISNLDVKSTLCCRNCPLHQLCRLCLDKGGKKREINPVSGSFSLAQFDTLSHAMSSSPSPDQMASSCPTDGAFHLENAQSDAGSVDLEWFQDMGHEQSQHGFARLSAKPPASPKRRLR